MSNHAFTIIPLMIEARGEIITNNLPEFRGLVREALGNINRDLTTDEEFGQAELDVKALKAAEDSVREAALKAFDDQLKALVDGLNETAEEIRVPRLELEKQITKRKEEVKSELIAEAMGKLDCAARLRQLVFGKSVAESIKGKRTLESMRKALEVVVTIHNGGIKNSRAQIESFVKAHGADLVMDAEDLEVKSPDNVEGELRRRFEAKKAEDERMRLKAEADAAKAEAEKAKADLVESKKPAATPADDVPARAEPVEDAAPWGDSNAPADISIETGTSATEWAAFKAQVMAAFGPLKVAKAGLRQAENIERASKFAQAVNAAWNEMKMEVAK